MSAADRRSGRIRRREEDEGDAQQTAQGVAAEPDNPPAGATAAAGSSPADPSTLASQPLQPSLSVQPLPEQFSQRKKQRRSDQEACHVDKLAVVELQLCLQFLDWEIKLKAARCSRRLMHAASHTFAWRDMPSFIVEVQSAADVQRIATSLLCFAPIRLRCDGLDLLQCAAAVPRLFGLQLLDSLQSSAADLQQLTRLLQHPNLARLQLLRLDVDASVLLTADTMRLIARLPRLCAFEFEVFLPRAADAALFQPLSKAPELTDLILNIFGMLPCADVLGAIGGCAGLRRLKLRCRLIRIRPALRMCSSANTRQLQHPERPDDNDDSVRFLGNTAPPGAGQSQATFHALQSLTLENDINALLPHLHRAPALRLLSIHCEPELVGSGATGSSLPRREELVALLTAAPQLEVHLLMPAVLDGWLAQRRAHVAEDRAMFEHQWRELQRMATELERVIVVDVHAQSL